MRYGRRISSGNRPHQGPSGRRRTRLNWPVAVLALVLLAGVGFGIAILINLGNNTPTQNVDNRQDGTGGGKFAVGVIVDGVKLDGLTVDEAKAKLASAQQARADAINITVSLDSAMVKFPADKFKASFDTDEVLSTAMSLSAAGVYKTTLSVDASAIEQDVRTFADALYIPPFDAMVTGFDRTKPDGQRFTFSEDRPGRQVNADALWAAVKKACDEGAFGTVQAVAEAIPAKAKKADLEANSKLIVSYQSTMYDHSKERLANIKLAARDVSSRMILPGEEFSFNGTTGERSAAVGYKIAHVLTAGVEDIGLGGGVCQVSGTLFNAAARANLQIVKRTPHSIPSNYLNKGQDATVDYPRKDLIIGNTGTTPVIIVMQVDDKSPWKVTAEIYGVPFQAGETIDLESQVTKTLPALTTERFEDSDAVDPGETKVIKPRKGYEITVFRIYKKDGVETRRERMDSVTYKPYGTVMLYNPQDAKPSGLPTPTPSPTPAPSATAKPAATPIPADPAASPSAVAP